MDYRNLWNAIWRTMCMKTNTLTAGYGDRITIEKICFPECGCVRLLLSNQYQMSRTAFSDWSLSEDGRTSWFCIGEVKASQFVDQVMISKSWEACMGFCSQIVSLYNFTFREICICHAFSPSYIYFTWSASHTNISRLRGQILGLWIYLACLPSPRLLVSFQTNTFIQTTTSALVRDVDGSFLCQLAFAKKRIEPIHSIQVGTLAWAQGLQILYQANPSHAPTCPVCIERRIDKLRIAINDCVQLGHRLKKTFAYFMHSILSSVIFLPLTRERNFPSERYRCSPLL